MEAPTYPPASVFEQPRLLPGQHAAASVTVGELLAAPATRAIVLSEPVMAALLRDPPFKAHLYNFTLFDLGAVVPAVEPALVARLEQKLAALPQNEWPTL